MIPLGLLPCHLAGCTGFWSAMSYHPNIITNDGDIARGIRTLTQQCSFMRNAYNRTGPPPLRRTEGGLPGLLRIVVGQQVSVASAAAIWARFEKKFAPLDALSLIRRRETTFRKAGLSGPKIKTVRAVAQAVVDGVLDFNALAEMPPEEAKSALVVVHGIGPWTADVYIMFCLGHADAWAPGDLALQIAAERLMSLDQRPTPDQLNEIAERWRPWRSVAARLLWAYYAKSRNVASALPVP